MVLNLPVFKFTDSVPQQSAGIAGVNIAGFQFGFFP